MVELLLTAFHESGIYKAASCIGNAYSASRLCVFVSALSRWYRESAIGKGLKRFTEKKPRYQYSFYQKAVDKKSEIVSIFTLKLHDFLGRLVEGSVFCGIYFKFLGNKGENKLRAIGIFGSYFFLAVTAMGIIGFIGGGRAAVSFCIALAFLAVTLVSGKIPALFENSFFVKLFLELIK